MSYSPLLLEHFKTPYRCLTECRTDVQEIIVKAGESGELDSFSVTLQVKNECICGVSFRALGCPYLLAILSYVCQEIDGGPLVVIKDFTVSDLIELFNVPRHKWYVVVKILDVLNEGINER